MTLIDVIPSRVEVCLQGTRLAHVFRMARRSFWRSLGAALHYRSRTSFVSAALAIELSFLVRGLVASRAMAESNAGCLFSAEW